MQPYLRKCFDNIQKIELETTNTDPELVSMTSSEPEESPEQVYFTNVFTLLIFEKVEHWLTKLLESMQQTL